MSASASARRGGSVLPRRLAVPSTAGECTVRGVGASQRVAVLDLGTNSTRLLLADVSDGAIEELDRRTNVTRLGEGVDATGRLSDEAVGRVLEVLSGYR